MNVVSSIWQWIVSIVLNFLSFLGLYHRPLQYFLPGQLIYYVRHENELSDQQVAGLVGWSNEQVAGADISSRRTITLPAAPPPEPQEAQPQKDDFEPQGFSENDAADGPLSKLTLIFASIAESADLVNVINALHERRQTQPVPDISLKLVAPHWLTTSSIHSPSTGGPGGWPVEAEPSHDGGYEFQVRQGTALMNLAETAGDHVHVAILDTVHPQHILDHAYDERHWHHPLIEDLLNPARSTIQYCRASFEDLHETADFSIMRHGYVMRDHGLFIAGLIHTLAPQAQLHLYEALNPYGVGTIESIANCLALILNDTSLRPVVINCSFTLGVPGNRKFDPHIPVNLQHPKETIEQLFESCNQPNVVVVAAAGNDSSPSKGQQSTRYPAAFKNVFGVGALTKASSTSGVRTASYSNRADDQNPDEGYMTLGGEPGVEAGIIGMYIDDFPRLSLLWRILNWLFGSALPDHIKYRRNLTGWAWWSGTSFATAILSGILAALPSTTGNSNVLSNFRNAQRELNQIATKNSQGENLLIAEQG